MYDEFEFKECYLGLLVGTNTGMFVCSFRQLIKNIAFCYFIVLLASNVSLFRESLARVKY